MSVWVSLEILTQWGVAFELVEQRPGDLIITAPGAYHQGWNAGASLAEAINYADGAAVERLARYRPCLRTCHPGAHSKPPIRLTWPPVSQELVRQDLASYSLPLHLLKKLSVWQLLKPTPEKLRRRLEALQCLFEKGAAKDLSLVRRTTFFLARLPSCSFSFFRFFYLIFFSFYIFTFCSYFTFFLVWFLFLVLYVAAVYIVLLFPFFPFPLALIYLLYLLLFVDDFEGMRVRLTPAGVRPTNKTQLHEAARTGKAWAWSLGPGHDLLHDWLSVSAGLSLSMQHDLQFLHLWWLFPTRVLISTSLVAGSEVHPNTHKAPTCN
jgi:hypothetical protein